MPLSGPSLPEKRTLSLAGESLACFKASNKANATETGWERREGSVVGDGTGRTCWLALGTRVTFFGFCCECRGKPLEGLEQRTDMT